MSPGHTLSSLSAVGTAHIAVPFFLYHSGTKFKARALMQGQFSLVFAPSFLVALNS